MNYLVHLYLAEASDESLLGNLMGDFIKGRLDDRFSPGIAAGIRLHRHVDSFAHTDPVFRRSKERLAREFGYFRGILVDIFYDHLMARDWPRYSSVPLETFAEQVYDILRRHRCSLPKGLQEVAPRMIRHNWLVSYADEETIRSVLGRISQRLTRPNPIAEGFGEWQRHKQGLALDFAEFLPRAQSSASRFISGNTPPVG